MYVDVICSGDAVPRNGQLLSTCIINEHIAIDAGALGTMVPAATQDRVSDIFLSHCHMDHVMSLPFFLEQRDLVKNAVPTIHAHAACIDALHKHFFNDLIWPDLGRIEREEGVQFCRFEDLAVGATATCHGVQVTSLQLSHTVPTFGFLVSDSSAVVAFISDTEYSPSWVQVLNRRPKLTGVFLECTFPTRLQWLAEKSKHMTPDDTARFMRQWDGDLPRIIINHAKPNLLSEVQSELEAALDGPFEMLKTGQRYEFG